MATEDKPDMGNLVQSYINSAPALWKEVEIDKTFWGLFVNMKPGKPTFERFVKRYEVICENLKALHIKNQLLQEAPPSFRVAARTKQIEQTMSKPQVHLPILQGIGVTTVLLKGIYDIEPEEALATSVQLWDHFTTQETELSKEPGINSRVAGGHNDFVNVRTDGQLWFDPKSRNKALLHYGLALTAAYTLNNPGGLALAERVIGDRVGEWRKDPKMFATHIKAISERAKDPDNKVQVIDEKYCDAWVALGKRFSVGKKAVVEMELF